MSTFEIIIAADTLEAKGFAIWLERQGHSAKVGDSTGNYVDGVWTSSDTAADEIMSRLWGEYCNS